MIGRVPGGAVSLTAAGARLALTYKTGTHGGVRVEVVDSGDAHPLYRVAEPAYEPRYRYYDGTQLDSKGDVLLTSTSGEAPDLVETGWWYDPQTRVGRPLPSADARVGASLSGGRIAYATSEEGGGERLEVLNLAMGTTRTIATFSGSAYATGIDLGETVVAWAQQSYGYELVNIGRYLTHPDFCVDPRPVGSTELIEALLSASVPIAVKVTPEPRPPGPSCVVE